MVERTDYLFHSPAASPRRQSWPPQLNRWIAGTQGNLCPFVSDTGAAILQLVRDSVESHGAIFVRGDPNTTKMEEAPGGTATRSELGAEPWHGVELRA